MARVQEGQIGTGGGRGRIDPELIARFQGFCDRMVRVAEVLDRARRSKRIVEQVMGAGTSVGANLFEADEALSRKDFAKCLGIAIKELNETRFWLGLIGRQNWIKPSRLEPLEREAFELKRILGAMLTRTVRGSGKR
jgi:four helix bundle protein